MNFKPCMLLCALVCVLPLLSGAAENPGDEAVPSFRAGAEVALGVTVKAPALWVINPGVPFRVTFEKGGTKTVFKVDKPVQDFKLKSYVHEIYVELPVKLSSDLKDGEVSIPFKVDCGICTEDEESCTFSSGTAEVKVRVANNCEPGAKRAALKKGVNPCNYVLPLP